MPNLRPVWLTSLHPTQHAPHTPNPPSVRGSLEKHTQANLGLHLLLPPSPIMENLRSIPQFPPPPLPPPPQNPPPPEGAPAKLWMAPAASTCRGSQVLGWNHGTIWALSVVPYPCLEGSDVWALIEKGCKRVEKTRDPN